MNRTLLIALVLLSASRAHAQLPQIRMNGIFPLGAQRGTTVDVTITSGGDLDEVNELIFSDKNISAQPKVDAAGTPVANKFTVKIAPTAKPGLSDVRARGLFGISNPRIFRIDTIPEIQETEPNNTTGQAQMVSLNTIVNCRANSAADVDTFKISVSANSPVVIRSEAAVLDSVMQPVLELFDANGRRVAHSRRRRQTDATVFYVSPVDQDLLLKVHDTVYAGSNDYGYRLSIDNRPLVDFTTPAVVQSGVESTVTLFGRHLPGGQPADRQLNGFPLYRKDVTVALGGPDRQMPGIDSSATGIESLIYAGVDGNLLHFAYRSESVVPATEENRGDEPQLISLPIDVAGSFSSELEQDIYSFDAKKGEQWQLDVMAARLGSSADPLLIVEQIVKAADGTETFKRLAREDTGKQNPGGNNLPTLTIDPAFVLNVPEDGRYQVRLQDRYAASRGNPALTYTLSIQKMAPNFRVVIFDSLPSADGKAPPSAGAISIRKGGTYTVPVYVYRSGGHNDNIHIAAKGMSGGITGNRVTIPAGKSSATLVLTASSDAKESTENVFFMGVSGTGEETITRAAKVATLSHAGANGLPRTARMSSSLLVGIMKDEEPFHVQPGIVEVAMTQDQQLLIPLKLTRRAGFDAKVDIAFSGQPKNVDIPKVAIDKGKDTAVARFYFKDNAAVGSSTLLMYATAKVPYSRNPWSAERARNKVAEAAKKLTAEQKVLTDSKTIAVSAAKNVADLIMKQKQLGTQLTGAMAAQTQYQNELKTVIAEKAAAAKQLLALKGQLDFATANVNGNSDDVDTALKAVSDAAAAVTSATRPFTALLEKIKGVSDQIAAKQKLVAETNRKLTAAKTQEAMLQQAVEKAKAAVTAAESTLKTGEAEKKAADEKAKKAEAAAKPKDLNLRTIAVPVRLTVHTTPGKILASVPNKGVIKKGTSVDVKVTLTRKNKFTAAVKVALVLADGTSGVTSKTVEIPADKTEAVLKFTAAADATPTDIAHAVVRAAAEFNGRTAHFDVPVTLKVTE